MFQIVPKKSAPPQIDSIAFVGVRSMAVSGQFLPVDGTANLMVCKQLFVARYVDWLSLKVSSMQKYAASDIMSASSAPLQTVDWLGAPVFEGTLVRIVAISCTVLLISNYPQIWFAATRAQRKLSGDATSQAKAYACDRPGYVSLHRREPHVGGSLRVREAL